MPNGPDQVVTSEGPLFCLSWCKRKRWLLVGGNARLHIYNVSFCQFYWLIITATEALLQACTGIAAGLHRLAMYCCGQQL